MQRVPHREVILPAADFSVMRAVLNKAGIKALLINKLTPGGWAYARIVWSIQKILRNRYSNKLRYTRS